MDWTNNDDIDLKRRLGRLVHRLDRMRRLKRGGVSSLPEKLRTKAGELVAITASSKKTAASALASSQVANRKSQIS
jgi:hypothetical protein